MNPRTFLGETEIRLRRQLALEGDLKDWTGNIQPVVIVADGTEPGSGSIRGRRWAINEHVAGAAGGEFINIQCDPDQRYACVIDYIGIGNALASTDVYVRIGAANIALPVAAVDAVPYVDRLLGDQEYAPIHAAGSSGGGSSAGTVIWRAGLGNNPNQYGPIRLPPIVLAPGQWLSIRNLTNTTTDYNLSGYIF